MHGAHRRLVGAVLFLRFGLSLAISALSAVGLLTVLAIYNVIAGRKRDRAKVSNQVSNIARGSGDLARQLAEFDRRLGFMESRVETVLERALSTARPLANEIEELSRLVNQLAETVAQHERRWHSRAPSTNCRYRVASPSYRGAPVTAAKGVDCAGSVRRTPNSSLRRPRP